MKFTIKHTILAQNCGDVEKFELWEFCGWSEKRLKEFLNESLNNKSISYDISCNVAADCSGMPPEIYVTTDDKSYEAHELAELIKTLCDQFFDHAWDKFLNNR